MCKSSPVLMLNESRRPTFSISLEQFVWNAIFTTTLSDCEADYPAADDEDF